MRDVTSDPKRTSLGVLLVMLAALAWPQDGAGQQTLFSSDGSSLSSFGCRPSTSLAVVASSSGHPAPSIEFDSPYGAHPGIGASYALPGLTLGQTLHGTLDLWFDAGYPGFTFGGAAASPDCWDSSRPVIPYFTVNGPEANLTVARRNASGVAEGVVVPFTVSPGAWHTFDFTYSPSSTGGFDFTLAVDGRAVYTGKSYGSLTAGQPLVIAVGPFSGSARTHARYDNVQLEILEATPAQLPFSSDGSTRSSFPCQPSSSLATVASGAGHPAPSIEFDSPYGQHPGIGAPYTLPALSAGQALHGTLDLWFEAGYPGFTFGGDQGTPDCWDSSRPRIPYFTINGPSQDMTVARIGASGSAEEITVPFAVTPNSWHTFDFTFAPSLSGGFDYALKVDGQAVHSGKSYGSLSSGEEQVIAIGPFSGSTWTHARYDNVALEVKTVAAPQIVSFSASPSSVQAGQQSTLAWSSSGATTATISGVGAVATSGTATVSPAAPSTTYTLTVTGPGGTASQQVTVTVSLSTPAALSLASAPICAGQTVTVPIAINAGAGAQAIEFEIAFDAAKLQATTAATGSLTPGFAITSNVTSGRIRVAMASASPLSASSGEIAKVTFQGQTGLPPGTSTTLALQNVRVNDLAGSGGSATVTCSCRRGDVNGNGSVTALDASLVLQAVVGAISLDATQACAADFNLNGSVTALDASAILQCVVTSSCP